jgi:hypothetical protein
VPLEQKDDNICPFCEEPLERDALIVDCPSCGAAHHTGCWQDNRGCANPHCAGRDEKWMQGAPGKKKETKTPPQRAMKPEEDPAARLTTPGRNVETEPEGPPAWLVPVVVGVACFVLGYITAGLVHRGTPEPSMLPDTAAVAPSPTQTEPAAASATVTELLAYEKDGQIYLQQPGAATATALTQKGGSRPAFSADGGKLLFEHNGIWVSNADGTDQRALTTDADKATDRFPTFSPDGAQIAFVRDSGKSGDLMLMKADGNGAAVLAKAKENEFWLAPVFFADGKTLLATLWDKANATSQVMQVSADGKTLTKVIALSEMGNAILAPGGKHVVYCRNIVPDDGSLKAGVYTAGLDGTGEKCLVPLASVDGAKELHMPACSPDGKVLAFVGFGAAPENTTADGGKNAQPPATIYSINADGSDLKKLGDGMAPAWGKGK